MYNNYSYCITTLILLLTILILFLIIFKTFGNFLPMAELIKKSKEKKLENLKKIEEYIKKYSIVIIAENNDIKNDCLKRLRSCLNGKVVFAKKSLLQRHYPSLNYDKNFFLIFTDDSELEKLNFFEYSSFLESGELSPINYIIPAGEIKNTKLASLLKPIEKKGSNTKLLKNFTVVLSGNPANSKAVEILKINDCRLINRKLTILDKLESKELKSTIE